MDLFNDLEEIEEIEIVVPAGSFQSGIADLDNGIQGCRHPKSEFRGQPKHFEVLFSGPGVVDTSVDDSNLSMGIYYHSPTAKLFYIEDGKKTRLAPKGESYLASCCIYQHCAVSRDNPEYVTIFSGKCTVGDMYRSKFKQL